MVTDKNIGILPGDISNILQVFRNHPKVKEVILFGSRAKGNFKNGSDIDLCLKGNQLELKDVLNLQIELDELLLPYTYDIIIFDRIQESDLVEHIERVGFKLL